MNTLRDAAQQALEALGSDNPDIQLRAAVTLRAALAEPQPEPVAAVGKRLIMVDETFDELMYWLDRCEDKGHLENCPDLIEPYGNFQYTTPPQRQPLSDEQISGLELPKDGTCTMRDLVRIIERAHDIGGDK